MTEEFSYEWYLEQEYYKKYVKNILKAIPNNLTLPEISHLLDAIEKKIYKDMGYKKVYYQKWKCVKVKE